MALTIIIDAKEFNEDIATSIVFEVHSKKRIYIHDKNEKFLIDSKLFDEIFNYYPSFVTIVLDNGLTLKNICRTVATFIIEQKIDSVLLGCYHYPDCPTKYWVNKSKYIVTRNQDNSICYFLPGYIENTKILVKVSAKILKHFTFPEYFYIKVDSVSIPFRVNNFDLLEKAQLKKIPGIF